MASSALVAAASLVLATADPLLDEGVSLLQLRAEKHLAVQAPTLGQANSECDENEILTWDQCYQYVVDNGIDARTNRDGPILDGRFGREGCYFWPNNKYVYYNTGYNPLGNTLPNSQPLCSPSGGRKQEKLDFPVDPMPEVELKPVGETCPPCGRLTLDQCVKVKKDNLVDTKPGGSYELPIVQYNKGGDGCYRDTINKVLYYNPKDGTAEGYAAKYDAQDQGPRSQHLCGVCTTTAEPVPEDPVNGDTAAASGDPHLIVANGERRDLAADDLQ